jgi:hypothetical protein
MRENNTDVYDPRLGDLVRDRSTGRVYLVISRPYGPTESLIDIYDMHANDVHHALSIKSWHGRTYFEVISRAK